VLVYTLSFNNDDIVNMYACEVFINGTSKENPNCYNALNMTDVWPIAGLLD